MMRKKTNYTQITPIPSHIPRRLAIDLLHAHGEIITLNPLVLEFRPVKAPRDAPADEFYSTWYEIEQRVQYVPGMGKMGAGKLKFQGCFHDMDYGIQTHMYAPANVDLRNKWRICGNQPGEPKEVPEIGIGAPAEGLYLREDVEIKCNIAMASFVKKEMRAAASKMVERLIKKAELLDAGVLQAMMEDGKLKTLNPADRTGTLPVPPRSPGFAPASPNMMPARQSSVYSMQSPMQQHQNSMLTPQQLEFQQFQQFQMQQQMMQQQQQQHPTYLQQPGKYAQSQQTMAMELPGDYYHPSQEVPQHLTPAWKRNSNMSELSGSSPVLNDGRWSHAGSESSRPTSYATDTSGMRSPKPEQTSFGSDLAPMKETKEEHDNRQTALNQLEGGKYQPHQHQQPHQQHQQPQPQQQQQIQHEKGWQPYNPADYAR
jgi:hypothetical protein